MKKAKVGLAKYKKSTNKQRYLFLRLSRKTTKKTRVKRPAHRYALFGLWFSAISAGVVILGAILTSAIVLITMLILSPNSGDERLTSNMALLSGAISAITFVFILYFTANSMKRKKHTLARWTRKSLNVLVILAVIPLLAVVYIADTTSTQNSNETTTSTSMPTQNTVIPINRTEDALSQQQTANTNKATGSQSTANDAWLEGYLKQQEETNKWLAERDRCWDLKKAADKEYLDATDPAIATRNAVLAEWDIAYTRMMQQNYPLYMIQGEERIFMKRAYTDTNAIIRPAYAAYEAEYESINSQGCNVGMPLYSDRSWPGY